MTLKDFSGVDFTNLQPQPDSRLFKKLPSELRNRIHELVYQVEVVPVTRQPNGRGFYRNVKTNGPGLLLSCKQAYIEGVKLYWGHSFFCFPLSVYGPSANVWLRKIAKRRCEHVRYLKVHDNNICWQNKMRNNTIVWRNAARPGPAGKTFCLTALKSEVERGLAVQKACAKSGKGVAKGVVKVGVHLPDKKNPELFGAQLTWTSDPVATAAPYLQN